MAKFTTVNGAIAHIAPATLKNWHDQKSIHLIDVREPHEYQTERIAGAVLSPLSSLEPEQLRHLTDRPIIIYCQSGRRSAQALQQLTIAEFTDIGHLDGGLGAWKKAGYPTQKNANAPISLFRQIQIVAGSLVVIGTTLGALVSPWFLLLSGFVGCGLVFAGVTNTCALGLLLAKLPYNQRGVSS